MKEIQKNLDKKGLKTFYFSIDLEMGNDIFLSSKNFINFIKTQINDEKIYVFIDEFQYIKEA
jgi:predicted AAA+ superfamily ATPase